MISITASFPVEISMFLDIPFLRPNGRCIDQNIVESADNGRE